MSMITASMGRPCRAASSKRSRASLPLRAVTTSDPARSRRRAITCRFASLSSASKIRALTRGHGEVPSSAGSGGLWGLQGLPPEALLGDLEAVGEEVDEDLLERQALGGERLRDLAAMLYLEHHAVGLGPGAERFDEVADGRRQRDRFEL